MFYDRKLFYILRILFDLSTIILCFLFIRCININEFNFSISIRSLFLVFSLTVVWVLSANSTGLYDEFRSRNFVYEFILIVKNVLLQGVTAVLIIFLINENSLPRIFIFEFTVSLLILITFQKYLFRIFLNIKRRRGRNASSLIIIGAGETGLKFYELISNNPHFGYNFLGFLDDQQIDTLNGLYLGKTAELKSILEEWTVDDILIALPGRAHNKIKEIITLCSNYTTCVRIIPEHFKFFPSKNRCTVSMFGTFPVISIKEEKINELHWLIYKRVFDFLFSLMVIVLVMSWLFPIIAIIIKIDSKGPVLFKQERWGRKNKKFIAYKFRSMYYNACWQNEEEKYIQATKNDQRVTRFGKFLRASNIDEMPQFFNVFLGSMSIVGPRPHPTPLNLESKNEVDHYLFRHLVKPGITGWAQTHGLRGETKEKGSMQKRVDYDIWYIENWSPLLDLQIIFMTIWKFLKGDPNAY